jgi:hypothetical protein
MADAVLRSAGGRMVLLRVPAPAVPGDLGEQLGLAMPTFQDVPLGPAIFRKVRAKTGTADKPKETSYELLLAASSVERAAGTLGMAGAEVLFGSAAGVLANGPDGLLLGIVWMTSAEAFGQVYLYRLGLRSAVKDVL